MTTATIDSTSERGLRDSRGRTARGGASRTTGLGTEAAGAGGVRLSGASRSVAVGRLAGYSLKHRRTVATNAGGRVVGSQGVSDRSSGHAGRHWVRASTSVAPSPQISPAGESLPLIAS